MKVTRNTDLIKAMGYSPEMRPSYERRYKEDAWTRVIDVTHALRDHSPLRARGGGGYGGYSGFCLTAEGRSYTVIILADDPAEWRPLGAHQLRSDMHSRLRDIDLHHMRLQMDKDFEEYKRRRDETESAAA